MSSIQDQMDEDDFLLDSGSKDNLNQVGIFDNLQSKMSEGVSPTKQENHQDQEDQFINHWKDHRLRKLEDFTKDLMKSAKRSSSKTDLKQCQVTESSNNEDEIEKLQAEIHRIEHQQKVLSPIVIDRNGEALLEQNQEQYEEDGEDLENDFSEIDDDLLLTKSENQLRMHSNAVSTHRSIQGGQSQGGEFEKRIHEIKSKLTQIKNTINTEIESSFQVMNNTRDNTTEIQQHPYTQPKEDLFQNRLNMIKQNLNSQSSHQSSLYDATQEKDRFQKLKDLVDQSYQSNSKQSSPAKKTTMKSDLRAVLFDEQQSNKEQSLRYQSHQDKGNSNTLKTENESLKQKLHLMFQGEQMLHKKLEQILTDQAREKDNYEQQLQRMQVEMTKMCDLIQEMSKQGKRKKSHNKCSKRKRIMELEQVVNDLQNQLDVQQKQQEVTVQPQREQTKPNNSEKDVLRKQVQYLEDKLKSLQQNVFENKESQLIKEQLRHQQEENEYLRQTYSKTYQEMMNTFSQFKSDMEKKQQMIEEDYRQRTEQIEFRFQQEIERRSTEVVELRKENAFLKDKICKIKEAFDLQRPLQDITNLELNHTLGKDELSNLKSGKAQKKNSKSKTKVSLKRGMSSTKQIKL